MTPVAKIPQSLIDIGVTEVGPMQNDIPIPNFEGIPIGCWYFAFKFYTHDNGYYELHNLGHEDEYDEGEYKRLYDYHRPRVEKWREELLSGELD